MTGAHADRLSFTSPVLISQTQSLFLLQHMRLLLGPLRGRESACVFEEGEKIRGEARGEGADLKLDSRPLTGSRRGFALSITAAAGLRNLRR